jgi:hypothetical protein
MAAFEPSTAAAQSADGRVSTFTDTSPYGDNDEGYVKSDFTVNTIVIKDAEGNILQTSSFLDSNTVTYNQTKDLWFTTERLLQGVAEYEKTQKFPLRRITNNKLQKVLGSGCCQGAANARNLCEANAFIIGAINAAPSGNSVAWQNDINAANSFLDLILQ